LAAVLNDTVRFEGGVDAADSCFRDFAAAILKGDDSSNVHASEAPRDIWLQLRSCRAAMT